MQHRTTLLACNATVSHGALQEVDVVGAGLLFQHARHLELAETELCLLPPTDVQVSFIELVGSSHIGLHLEFVVLLVSAFEAKACTAHVESIGTRCAARA